MPATATDARPRDYDVVSRDIADLIAEQLRIIAVRFSSDCTLEEWNGVPNRLIETSDTMQRLAVELHAAS